MSERFSAVKEVFSALCGRTKVGFQNATYLSERTTADRNFCLGKVTFGAYFHEKHFKIVHRLVSFTEIARPAALRLHDA